MTIAIFLMEHCYRPEVTSNFTPPKEREMYLAAKAEEDATSTASKTKLKKLLMRRAMATIPLLLTLRNEGTSIERLYKKGAAMSGCQDPIIFLNIVLKGF